MNQCRSARARLCTARVRGVPRGSPASTRVPSATHASRRSSTACRRYSGSVAMTVSRTSTVRTVPEAIASSWRRGALNRQVSLGSQPMPRSPRASLRHVTSALSARRVTTASPCLVVSWRRGSSSIGGSVSSGGARSRMRFATRAQKRARSRGTFTARVSCERGEGNDSRACFQRSSSRRAAVPSVATRRAPTSSARATQASRRASCMDREGRPSSSISHRDSQSS